MSDLERNSLPAEGSEQDQLSGQEIFRAKNTPDIVSQRRGRFRLIRLVPLAPFLFVAAFSIATIIDRGIASGQGFGTPTPTPSRAGLISRDVQAASYSCELVVNQTYNFNGTENSTTLQHSWTQVGGQFGTGPNNPNEFYWTVSPTTNGVQENGFQVDGQLRPGVDGSNEGGAGFRVEEDNLDDNTPALLLEGIARAASGGGEFWDPAVEQISERGNPYDYAGGRSAHDSGLPTTIAANADVWYCASINRTDGYVYVGLKNTGNSSFDSGNPIRYFREPFNTNSGLTGSWTEIQAPLVVQATATPVPPTATPTHSPATATAVSTRTVTNYKVYLPFVTTGSTISSSAEHIKITPTPITH